MAYVHPGLEARAGQQPETAAERNRAATEATDEETTGTVRQSKADSEEREELTLDEGAQRVEAIEGLDKRVEDNPFEAPGIRAGTFILRPSIEQGVTATTNADSSSADTPDTSDSMRDDTAGHASRFSRRPLAPSPPTRPRAAP